MTQANIYGEKVDVEHQRPGTLSSPDEKRPLASEEKRSKMPSFRHLLVTLLTVTIFASALCSADLLRIPRSPTPRDQQKFQEFLEAIEPSSLHEVLHSHVDQYKHGVYQDSKTAVAIIHQQTPEVATSLIALAKRQEGPSGNGTSIASSTTDITTGATSTVTTQTTSTSVFTPTSSTTPPSSTEESSVSSVPTSTSGSTSSETTSSDDSTPTPTDTLVTSISEGSSSPTNSGSSSSKLPPTPTSITSFNIYTTTLANGVPTTITQVTIVPAGGVPDQTGGSTKTNPSASLQTNGAGSKMMGSSVIMSILGMIFLGAI